MPTTDLPASAPIAQVRLNGSIIVPLKSVKVEKTAFSVADTVTATTFLAGSKVDYGKLAQSVIPCPFEVFLGSGPIASGAAAASQRLVYGLMDQTTTTYEQDAIELTARGVLALLIDQRMTARLPMNTTIDKVIAGIITQFNLTPQVTATNVRAGDFLNDDFVSMARNQRAFDIVVALADYMGWSVRVQGTTVIVGPPAVRGTVPELAFEWGRNAGTTLHVTHDALHTREIKVVVKSYIPRTKARPSSVVTGLTSTQLAVLGLPAEAPSSAQGQIAPSGRQSGFTSVGEDFSGEVYTLHIPGKTLDQADAIASQQRDDITRREFVAEISFTPNADQLSMLVPAGCEFTVYITGCSQSSHNGLYHPKQVTWEWAIGQSEGEAPGLVCTMQLVNHELPSPSSGTI